MKRRAMIGVILLVVAGTQLAQAANPVGALDRERDGWLEGWAYDADDMTAKVRIHFYVEEEGARRRIAGQARAKFTREDLAGTERQGHAFSWKIPAPLRDGREHTIKAFALNVGEGTNVALPKPVRFTLAKETRDFSKATTTKLKVAGAPGVWMCKGHPWGLAKSGEWPFVRDHVDCVKLYIGDIDKAGPERLRDFAALQRAHGFKVAVELGGLVDWEAPAKEQSGERSFACEYAKVRKFTDPVEKGGAGGTVHWLDLDGPFRRMMYPRGKEKNYHTLESAGRELVDCLELWRAKYPELKFNLLTNFYNYGWNGAPAYNDFGFKAGSEGWGDYKKVFDFAVKVTGEAGVPLDGLTIDAPFDYARGDHASNQAYVIRDVDFMTPVRELEDHARSKGLKVRLIYNSERPGNKKGGVDKAYFEETLAYMDAYHARGGRPDAYIIQSWYAHPRKWLPEDEPYTMTNLVKAAIRKLRPRSR